MKILKWPILPIVFGLHALLIYVLVIQSWKQLAPSDIGVTTGSLLMITSELDKAKSNTVLSDRPSRQDQTVHKPRIPVQLPASEQPGIAASTVSEEKDSPTARPLQANAQGGSFVQNSIENILKADAGSGTNSRTEARTNASQDKFLLKHDQDNALGRAIKKAAKVDCLEASKKGEVSMGQVTFTGLFMIVPELIGGITGKGCGG